jgi:hypothetical protein
MSTRTRKHPVDPFYLATGALIGIGIVAFVAWLL